LNHPEVGLPPQISIGLANDYRSSLVVSLLREAALRSLLDAFNSCGVPVILLKGAYLGPVAYQDPALRPMGDLDVLIRDEDFGRAVRLIEDLDYRLVSPALYARDTMFHPALTFSRRARFTDTVDLHRRIRSMDYYRFPSAVIWDQAVETQHLGDRTYFLTPELNFIHLSVHNLDHAGRLRDWLDLTVLAGRVELNWDRLVHLAWSMGVVRPMFRVFEELCGTWQWSPPPEVLTNLAAYSPRWMEDRVIRGRFRYLWRIYSRLSLLDGWRDRLDYLGAKVFPPRDYRLAFAGTPRWLPYVRVRVRRLLDTLRTDRLRHRD